MCGRRASLEPGTVQPPWLQPNSTSLHVSLLWPHHTASAHITEHVQMHTDTHCHTFSAHSHTHQHQQSATHRHHTLHRAIDTSAGQCACHTPRHTCTHTTQMYCSVLQWASGCPVQAWRAVILYTPKGKGLPGGFRAIVELLEFLTFSSVQLLSPVWLFATPWAAARQAYLSITNSRTSNSCP